MWSDRYPSIGVRQTIFPDARLMPTTSAKLGRDTATSRPLRVLNMSSTNWSWPCPICSRMARKNASFAGSA